MSLRPEDRTATGLAGLSIEKITKVRSELDSLLQAVKTIRSHRTRIKAIDTVKRLAEELKQAEYIVQCVSKAHCENVPWGVISSDLRDYAIDFGNESIAMHILRCERDFHGKSLKRAAEILPRIVRELSEDLLGSIESFLEDEDAEGVDADHVANFATGWMHRSRLSAAVAWELQNIAVKSKAAKAAPIAQPAPLETH